MVPFDMRVLHAELPQHVSRLHDSVDRLSRLHTVISQVSSVINSESNRCTEVSHLSVDSAYILSF